MLSASRWTLPPSSPVVLVSKPLLTAYTPRRHRLPPLLNAARLPRACAPAALPRASDLSAIKSFYLRTQRDNRNAVLYDSQHGTPKGVIYAFECNAGCNQNW
jgi:hypothetical protein